MATRTPKAIVIPTPRLVSDALALAARFRDVQGLQRHVEKRRPLMLAAAAALVLFGLSCGAGVFMFLAGHSTWLTLPAVFLAPLVVLGSLFVLFYVFYAWIEGRALAQALGHRPGSPPGPLGRWLAKKLRADVGPMPAVPWLPAGLLVVLPLVLLAAAAPLAALALILLAIAMPILYARFDARR